MNAAATAVVAVCMLFPAGPVSKHYSTLLPESSTQPEIRLFHEDESGITADGSKILLVFDRFDVDPTVQNPGQLTFTLRYPTNGGTGTSDEVIECCLVRVESDRNDEQQLVTRITCHLGPPAIASDNASGYIRSGDQILPVHINLPEGWASSDNQEKSQQIVQYNPTSLIKYPKPIVTWDVVPHEVFDGQFDIDVVPFHMQSYPGSPFGDLKVESLLDYPGAPPNWQQAAFREKVPQRAGFPKYGVYGITYDAAQVLYDGPATVKFRVTPARGDAQSILSSTPYSDNNTYVAGRGVQPNREELRIFLNGSGTFSPLYAVVKLGAQGGMLDADPDMARQNPFPTVEAAKEAFRAANTQHLAIILLQPGLHAYGPRPDEPAPGAAYINSSWLVIKPDDLDTPPVMRDQVTITNAAFDLTFDVEEETAFKFRRIAGSDDTLIWRWTTAAFQIKNETGQINFQYPRVINQVPQTVQNLIDGMRTYFMRFNNQVEGFVEPDHENWLLTADDARFIGLTEFQPLPAENVFVNVPGWVRARVTIEDRNNERWMDIEYNLATQSYNLHGTADIATLINNIANDFDGIFVPPSTQYLDEVLPRNLKLVTDADLLDEQPITLFEQNSNALFTRYVKIENCQTYNINLVSNTASPDHLWMHRCLTKDATQSGMDTSTIIATDNLFRGGVWFTEQEWDTANKCTSGCVMARDSSATNIGGDIFKQCSYACNIQASDVAVAFPFYVHPDHFQWSPGPGPDIPGLFQNIIALNLDFRDNCNGQPFLFNPVGLATWEGVALVNWRMDAAQQQSMAGNGDRILLWYSTILQGTFDETGKGFAIFFNGEGPFRSQYTNLSVRNLVCERLPITGEGGNPNAGGDVPSLFAALDNCHIDKELRDNTLERVMITLFPECTTHDPAALHPLFDDYPLGEWRPHPLGQLSNRVGDEDIVYRYDALGVNRAGTVGDGAIGAVEQD